MRLLGLCLSVLAGIGMVSCDAVTDAYNAFSNSTAVDKVTLAQTMLTETTYTPENRPTLNWKTDPLVFAENVNHIQKVSFINPLNLTKPVHRFGTASTVEFNTISGVAPSGLFISKYGVIRFSSGQATKVIGVGLAVFGDNEQVQTRVFSSDKSTKYNIPIGQINQFQVSSQGPEGRLFFVPAPVLHNIDIADNIGHDYRTDFEALPVGTVVGTITQDTSDFSGTPFVVEVKITSKQVSAQASDQNWWFRRNLKGVNLAGKLFLPLLEAVGFGGDLFSGKIGEFFETQVDVSTVCPVMAAQQSKGMINEATIAAIVVASVATIMAIASTSVLVMKIRKQNTVQETTIPL